MAEGLLLRPVACETLLIIALVNNRPCPLMWVVWSRQAAQSSRSTHSKVWFQKNPFTPYPLSLPSSPTGCCLAIFWGAADVELVAGTSYSIRLCGLGNLSVAMRSALDWTADTKWAAASSLNCENKYWMGLRCASQASSPIVICLGVHTGGSVCLGLKPPHVVAARFFFPRWIALFENAFNKTGCWIWGSKNSDSFCTCDIFPHLCSLPLSKMRSAQTGRVYLW